MTERFTWCVHHREEQPHPALLQQHSLTLHLDSLLSPGDQGLARLPVQDVREEHGVYQRGLAQAGLPHGYEGELETPAGGSPSHLAQEAGEADMGVTVTGRAHIK